MLCHFLNTGLSPPWLGLFLGTLFFLLVYLMGFFSEKKILIPRLHMHILVSRYYNAIKYILDFRKCNNFKMWPGFILCSSVTPPTLSSLPSPILMFPLLLHKRCHNNTHGSWVEILDSQHWGSCRHIPMTLAKVALKFYLESIATYCQKLQKAFLNLKPKSHCEQIKLF